VPQELRPHFKIDKLSQAAYFLAVDFQLICLEPTTIPRQRKFVISAEIPPKVQQHYLDPFDLIRDFLQEKIPPDVRPQPQRYWNELSTLRAMIKNDLMEGE
jgi:hypothetical protein